MQLRMSDNEGVMFAAFLRSAINYLEFGTGGSTVLASRLISGNIYAVDSSPSWLEAVRDAAAGSSMLHLTHVDIGATKEWGYPVVDGDTTRFRSYSTDIWRLVGLEDLDLVLVDGRFRVACFSETVARANENTIILFHDYRSRPVYHVVETIAHPIAECEDLTAFRFKASARAAAKALARKFHEFPG